MLAGCLHMRLESWPSPGGRGWDCCGLFVLIGAAVRLRTPRVTMPRSSCGAEQVSVHAAASVRGGVIDSSKGPPPRVGKQHSLLAACAAVLQATVGIHAELPGLADRSGPSRCCELRRRALRCSDAHAALLSWLCAQLRPAA